MFGDDVDGPCPALTRTAPHRYECGLVHDPLAHALEENTLSAKVLRNAALLAIGSGTGCDSRSTTDPDYPPEFHARQRRWNELHGAHTVAAFIAWLGPDRTHEVVTRWVINRRPTGKTVAIAKATPS